MGHCERAKEHGPWDVPEAIATCKLVQLVSGGEAQGQTGGADGLDAPPLQRLDEKLDAFCEHALTDGRFVTEHAKDIATHGGVVLVL